MLTAPKDKNVKLNENQEIKLQEPKIPIDHREKFKKIYKRDQNKE